MQSSCYAKVFFFAIEKEIIDFLNISLTVNLNLRKYFIWGSAFLLKFSVVICSIYLQFGEFEKVPFSPKEIELRWHGLFHFDTRAFNHFNLEEGCLFWSMRLNYNFELAFLLPRICSLREGNVLSHVCLSFCLQVGEVSPCDNLFTPYIYWLVGGRLKCHLVP